MNFNNIKLDKTDRQPLYRQLAEQIQQAIVRGELVDGERLPAIRAWKVALGVSPVTATQAYELLAERGFASGQVGRGTYVSVPAPHVREQSAPYIAHPTAPLEVASYVKIGRTSQLQRYLQTALNRYELSPNRPATIINASSGNPAPELFAVQRWNAAMARAGESFENGDQSIEFQYGLSLGDRLTREWLTQYVQKFGIRSQPDEIMLTTGSQQALDLIARTFLGPDDYVLVESPSYFSALEIFENRGVKWLPVPMDDEGVQIDVLENLAERYRPKLLYVVPLAQSPMGVTLAQARRVRLLELARRYNFLIVEDDSCNEFYYNGDVSPLAIKSSDTDGRVIYIKSFSKLIFPVVRFGLILAQGQVLERLLEAKAVFDRITSLPVARAVLKFATHPAFGREIVTACAAYRTRRDTLLNALESEIGKYGCRWSRVEAGFSLLVTLPRGLRAQDLYLLAAEHGLLILPGTVYYPTATDAPDNTFRLCFGDNPPAVLEEIARRLGKAIQVLQMPRLSQNLGFVAAV